jgi:hypothetical protein
LRTVSFLPTRTALTVGFDPEFARNASNGPV